MTRQRKIIGALSALLLASVVGNISLVVSVMALEEKDRLNQEFFDATELKIDELKLRADLMKASCDLYLTEDDRSN